MPDDNPGGCTAYIKTAGVLLDHTNMPERLWCEHREGHPGRHHASVSYPGAETPSTLDWVEGAPNTGRMPVVVTTPFRGPVPPGAYNQAMRLLGLDPDDPDRALVSVHIEGGQVNAHYAQVIRISPEGAS